MMALVTLEGGTGVNAAPQGYAAAGKTGTAQVMDPVTKHYASRKYTSVFTGYIPAEQPRLVISVVVHEPQGAIYGGVVAAPVFREIAAKALPYLGVMPSVPHPAPVPAVRQVNADPAVHNGKAGAKPSSAAHSAKQAIAKKPVPKEQNSGTVQVNARKGQEKPKTTSRTQPEKYSKAEGKDTGLY
jgi:cell division protein FtsI (penicillin-binding protein 3)